MSRRCILGSILLLLIALPAFSGFGYRPSIGGWVEGVACYPTADYLRTYPGDPSRSNPPLRTSLAAGVDVNPIVFSFSDYDGTVIIGGGFTFYGVSPSLSYGISQLKPYAGFGLNLDLQYRNDLYGVELKYRYVDCNYQGTEQHFLSQDFEICPFVSLSEYGITQFLLGVPVCIAWKADAVSVRLGVSMTMVLDCFERGGR